MMMMPPPPMLTVPTSLKNARLEALSVPDRTQTPGIQSPFSAANVLCAMMTRGSDDENEHPTAPAPKPRAQGKRTKRVPRSTFGQMPEEAPNDEDL